MTIKNTATNYERQITTDRDGRFRGLLLPLGPYKVTVSLTGFSTLVREGLNLSVGQTVNLPLTLKVSSIQEEVVVSGESPVIETTRAEGADKIDEASIKGLPNNGRNFLDFTKLTPGVSIVQGPDGDELTINGQKGIVNNISVDGADFNNPFFGEQRGGQRPAFTFNLDAVKEIVVVAEGANAEFGRSQGGFVNVVTKSGTNDVHGTAHAYFKDDSLSSAPKRADGSSDGTKYDFTQQQFGFTLGGPLKKDKVFYFLALDYQNGESTKQTDPSRIEQRVVDYFASIGSPNENGSITRTNDARVFLGKIDWQLNPNHLLTLRYNYTWAEQANGTFDVDSWGTSNNALEKDYSHAGTASLISSFSANVLNEFRFQFAREYRPRPYKGPNISGQDRPLPDTAFDFGAQLPLRPAVLHSRRVLRPARPVQQQPLLDQGTAFLQGGGRVQPRQERPDLHRLRQRPLHLQLHRRLPELHPQPLLRRVLRTARSSQTGQCPAGSSVTGPVLLYLQQAGVGGLTVEEAGTQSIPQNSLAFFVQDKWQPSRKLTVQFGLRWEGENQADPITPVDEVFYRDFIGKTVNTAAGPQTFPSDGSIPSDYQMWQPRLGIAWDPNGDGKSIVRLNGGVFYGRVPGLSLASSRSTNGSRGQTLFRNSALTGILGAVPAYPNIIPQSEIGIPFFPDVFVFDQDFENPRTYQASIAYERQFAEDFTGLIQYNYAAGRNITGFLNRNDPLLGSPWSSGLAPGGHQRHRRPHHRLLESEEQLQRHHLRPHQALVEELPVPDQLFAVLGQVRRRQRARSLHLRIRQNHGPRGRVRLLGS